MVSCSFLNNPGGIFAPEEDLDVIINNNVGHVVVIGSNEQIIQLSCVECIGSPLLVQISQNPVSILTLLLRS